MQLLDAMKIKKAIEKGACKTGIPVKQEKKEVNSRIGISKWRSIRKNQHSILQ